ncbi:hypothetical protein HanRHA438_Chr02g0065771 [Helianthus annuus]|nr:hypothetical protein HanRHA438_Chr02g0065771 [Helianthus annuus]
MATYEHVVFDKICRLGGFRGWRFTVEMVEGWRFTGRWKLLVGAMVVGGARRDLEMVVVRGEVGGCGGDEMVVMVLMRWWSGGGGEDGMYVYIKKYFLYKYPRHHPHNQASIHMSVHVIKN